MSRDIFWGTHSAEHYAQVVLTCLHHARERPARDLVRAASESLVRFHERRLVTGEVSEERLRALRAEFRTALAPVAEQVRRWGVHALGLAQNGREDGQFDACLGRSAFQFLLDDYEEVPEIARMREEVDDFDDELRRMCDSYGSIADENTPRGLPASHWWWHCARAPAAPSR